MTEATAPGTPPARGGGWSLVLLALTSVIMLLLVAAFHSHWIEGVASRSGRLFCSAVSLAVAAPYAWVLVQLWRGRPAEGALAGIVCALLYLIGFGWFAVVLFLLSFGGLWMWIPALALPVQLVQLIAAFALWRTQPEPERAAASWGVQGVVVPAACVLLPLAVAGWLHLQIKQSPAQRQAQAADAVRLVTELQKCLVDHAARHGGGFPDGLEGLAADKQACSGVLMAMAQASVLTRLVYRAAPPTPAGVRPAFTLCALPTEVPDNGVVTVVSDASGPVRQEYASGSARLPVSCEAAWGSDLTAAVKRLRFCLIEYAAMAGRGYPKDLVELQRQLPQCATHMRASGDLPKHFALGSGFGEALGVQYLAGEAAPGAAIATYQLYLQCPGLVDKVAVDERGVVDDASPAARWWRNGCRNPAPAAEQMPRFGNVPDLAARRADCRERAQDCHGLALELERSVHLAGGNPHRVDTLDAAQKALIEEANRALAQACEAGRARACTAWADVLLRGRGMAEDPPQALRVLQRTCAGGFAEACVGVAELLEKGRAPTLGKDTAAAIAAFKSACTLGDTVSCLRASRLTLESTGATTAEREGALVELRSLCEAGQGFACSLLAQQAAASGGVVAGRGADEWRRRACALGERTDCRG